MSSFEHSPIRILLDMDGVLVDFHKEAIGALGFDYDIRYPKMQSWAFYEDLGLSEEEFYGWLNNVGQDFWATLPYTKYGKILFEACSATAPTYVCTSPTMDLYSAPGKLSWMANHLGHRFNRYAIGSHKHLLARPGHILIDDSDKNIAAFRKEGGTGILYPQPWNEGRETDHTKAYQKVLEELNAAVAQLNKSSLSGAI